MTTKTNPARGIPRKATTAGRRYIPCESCAQPIYAALQYHLCRTCWTVDKVCRKESVETIAELARESRDSTLWRAAHLIRQTGADDAERIIRQLERLTA